MKKHQPRWVRLVVTLVAASLAATACTDDDSGDAKAEPKTVAVTATDFAFEGLPDKVAARTRLTLTNASNVEVHELVAVRLPDTERRPTEELVTLPIDQLMALLSGPPQLVLVAPPGGGPQVVAEGDGTLSQPGRYLVLCTVPTGVDAKVYLEGSGPPQGSGGPPHSAHGMFAELTVE